MSLLVALGTAAALGASSGAHCAAMCGPLAAVGCSREGHIDGRRSAGYLGGRALGYAAAGGLAGGLGAPLAAGSAGTALRMGIALIVAIVLIYRALAFLRPAAAARLVTLGKKPKGPGLLDRLVPLLPRRGLGLGLATAVFPCGALWGALLAASASGSPAMGALMMTVFALASVPLLMLPALLGARIGVHLQEGRARKLAALALVAAAVWVVVPPALAMMQPASPSCCHARS